jgi:C-8 sterol isomerase
MSKTTSSRGFGRLLTFLAVIVAILSPIVYVLDKNLESFYIFNPEQLHDLQKRAIAQHGNNTRGVVGYIVEELNQKLPYISQTEEWFFNNAGGAMGGVYIIHASEQLVQALSWRRYEALTYMTRRHH